MLDSSGRGNSSCSRSIVAFASPLLVVAAAVLWWHGPNSLRPNQVIAGSMHAPEDRRLLAMQQAATETTYRVAFKKELCNDTGSLLFDSLETGDKKGYRIQAACEEKCNQNGMCQFMLWGWNPGGYYRCATFTTCNNRKPYMDGEPTVFEKTWDRDNQQEDEEPHTAWVGGAYAESNDPLTMEFCSLGGECDAFGPVAPLPSNGGVHKGCMDRGGRWCSTRPPLDELFSPVDGGTGRACRRSSEDDNSKVYYHIKKLGAKASFAECQGICLAHGDCTGIEHIAFVKEHRCEIWQTRIMATLPLKVATCLRHVNWMDAPNCCLRGSCGACEELGKLGVHDQQTCNATGGQWCDPAYRWYGLFAPVDGGVDRACRGAEPWDNDPSYFVTHLLGLEDSIELCKQMCLDNPHCKGIEYTVLATGPRCRIWTRRAGIGAGEHSEGSTCLRWTR